jgi:hypothetical protein
MAEPGTHIPPHDDELAAFEQDLAAAINHAVLLMKTAAAELIGNPSHDLRRTQLCEMADQLAQFIVQTEDP